LAGFMENLLRLGLGSGPASAVRGRQPQAYENDRRSICKVKDEGCGAAAFAAGPSDQNPIDAQRAWCKSQNLKSYSVLVRPINGRHA
jgi:hypothetical protein